MKGMLQFCVPICFVHAVNSGKSKAPGFFRAGILVIVSWFLFCPSLSAQEKKLSYNIKRNGSVIGNMQLYKKDSGTITSMRLESAVKTSMLISIRIASREDALFENGILSYSYLYRKVNDDVKLRKTHRKYGNQYVVSQKTGKTDTVRIYPVRYNILCLYFEEPVNLRELYSDNYQRMLQITKIGQHQYKIKLPDGNYQNYYYQNGVCHKIVVDSSFFTITMELI